jgi:signal transduction histidine kinase
MTLQRAFGVLVALAIAAFLLCAIALVIAVHAGSVSLEARTAQSLDGIATHLAEAYARDVGPLAAETPGGLPPGARAALARGIAANVLGPYDDVEGAFWSTDDGFADAVPRADSAAVSAIAALAARAASTHAEASTVLRGPRADVVVVALPVSGGDVVAWVMQRARPAEPGLALERWLAIAATFAALALVALGALILAAVRRDLARLLSGIARLRDGGDAPIGGLRGEFGAVASAVSAMAAARARAEDERRRTERLAALGQLVGGVAHEVRNPLNALRLHAARIERRTPESAPLVARLVEEIARLDAVVTRMLAFGRTAERREPVDLAALAERTARLFGVEASARGVTLHITHVPDTTTTSDSNGIVDANPGVSRHDTTVLGDPVSLEQLLINLVTNALDAAPPGTTVEVRVEPGPVLRAIDAGAGIAPADRARVFDPFYTTKPDGNGLGLSIAHEIARAHGATLTFTSEPGRTEFVLAFAPLPGGSHLDSNAVAMMRTVSP